MNFSRAGFLFVLMLLLGCTAAPAAAPTPPPDTIPTDVPAGPPTRLKLFVSADGIYRVAAAALQNAGVEIDKVDSRTLQLFFGDQEISLGVQGAGKDWFFDFYGQASASPYSNANVYWLTWGAQAGKRMSETPALPARGAPQVSFSTTVHIEHPTFFAPQFGEPDAPWFWQALVAPMTTTLPLTLTAVVAAPAQLRVNLWGSTQDAANPDHHLSVFFNDARIADQTWDGQGARTITGTAPAAAVRAGVNNVRLVAPGDTRAQADVALLSSLELTYTRKFTAQDDSLDFNGAAGTYRLDGFSSDAIDLFNITDPTAPKQIISATINARTLAFAADAPTPQRWLAIGARARKTVDRIAPMTLGNLRTLERQADYVVITYPGFVSALQPLVRWRQAHGLKVRVATTTQVYDEFGFGVESPLALRAFLDWIQQNWKSTPPRFVLLVGKASYDYRDYTKGANKNLLPTFLVETPNLRQAASDNWFVSADAATDRPALALGRIPAKTPEQVTQVVNKIIAYESGQPADWRKRAVFVADDKDVSFQSMADLLAGKVGAGLQAQKVYLAEHQGDLAATRADIISRWNSGALIMAYIGHGSIDTWAEGPLFSAANLGEIKNGERLPILITPTCLDGFFYHPQKDSLAEDLLFKNDGGIIAGLVPTGLSMPDAQSQLMQALFDQLFSAPAPTLGEAILRAKQQTASAAPNMREVIDTFGLLGDPALTFGK